jgi:hypothetical protein
MNICIETLGAFGKIVGPINDEKLLTLGILTFNGGIQYGWRKYPSGAEIVKLNGSDWSQWVQSCQSRSIPAQATWVWLLALRQDKLIFIPAQATWVWLLTLDYIIGKIKYIIRSKNFIPSNSILEHELVWNVVLNLSGKNKLLFHVLNK